MSTFNSAATAEFNGGVWVFCEQRQGEMMTTSYELISEGRKLANELGTKLYGILLGDQVEGLAKELGGYGADKIIVCNHPLLKDYTTDAYAKVLCDTVMAEKPEIVLFGATNIGRDLAPRCAARLHTGLCADCTHLDIDVAKYTDFLRTASTLDVDGTKWNMEDQNLKMTRPAFGGHLMATIICPRFRPCMATVRPGVMKKNPFDQAKADACEIVKPAFELKAEDLLPFQSAIEQEVGFIIVSHAVLTALDDQRPCSMSPAAISLLRDDMGFKGIILTDALDIPAIIDLAKGTV